MLLRGIGWRAGHGTEIEQLVAGLAELKARQVGNALLRRQFDRERRDDLSQLIHAQVSSLRLAIAHLTVCVVSLTRRFDRLDHERRRTDTDPIDELIAIYEAKLRRHAAADKGPETHG